MSKPLTRIEPDEIKQLGPEQLVRLLHQLLLCEARSMALSQPGILVPYQINVPDGGSDGEWKPKGDTGSFSPNEFIPRDWTRYQSKAERITEGKCRGAIAPPDAKNKPIMKARVKEVLEKGGCYAFFSNGHEVKPSGDKDIDTIARDQMSNAGFTPHADALIEFFGCNRIADWTNKFPATVRYVREVTKGFGGLHYFTYEGWTKLGNVSGAFFDNDAITQKIRTIRETLLGGQTRMIRMTGLSGVGKSRLVYEALKPSKNGNTEQDSLSASCIYLSYESVTTDLLGLIGHLADNEYAAIVVVDDCPPDIHDRLANIAANSLLSIITIFHEPQQQRSDSHPLNLAPEEMEEVVEKILRGDANLAARGDAAIKAVASFAQGFPQIAKLIVEFHRAPTVDELNDRAKVFQKLLSQGDEPDKTTLVAAQTLSLFRTIGGSASKLECDLSTIREIFCPEISEIDYRRSIEAQKRRRIVQQIADTLVLAPRPLGVALAADFISFYPTQKWKEVVDKLSQTGLLSEFRRRIEELEFSDKAEALGKMFLEIGLPFNDAEYLLTGTTGSQMFRSLTVLNPLAAIKTVRQALSKCTLRTLHEAQESRRDLVRALELLVWEPDTFQDSATMLIKLAAAENEGWSNNATGAVNQLFHLQLSGTKVPAIDRLGVINDALESDLPAIRRVAITALGAALNFRHFSRMSDTTLAGKRDANYDWRPKSNKEALSYWRECFRILAALILKKGDDETAAKSSLEKNIAVILQTPLLLELEPEFKGLCDHYGQVWPEVKDQIKGNLDIHDDLTVEHREALLRCKEYLTPREADIAATLRDIVTEPGWHHRKEADSSYTDISREEAELLAAEYSAATIDLDPFLPILLVGEQQQGFSFGTALGKAHPRAEGIVDSILALWPDLDPEERNPTLVRGLLRGLASNGDFKSKTLDYIASEPNLIDLLVPLTAALDEPSEVDFIRVRKAVLDSSLDPLRLRGFIQGLPLQALPSSFLVDEFTAIFRAKPEAAQVLFEILFLHCHRNSMRFEELSPLFRDLLLAENLVIGDSHFGWEWHEVALKLIDSCDDVDWLQEVSKYICGTLAKSKTWVGTDYLGTVASKLFEKAPTETWSSFAEALSTGDDFERYVIAEFLGKSGSVFDDTSSPLWTMPEDHFRRWVQANRSLIPLILDKISLYTVEKAADDLEVFKWHPHALVLLSEGTDEEEIEKALMGNLFSFGSTGSRVPYLERRIELVRDLSGMGDARLKRIGQSVEQWLTEELERTKREELNENARWM